MAFKKLERGLISFSIALLILLFGSRSKGSEHSNSDYDLLIVMPDGSNRRATAQFLYKNIENVKDGLELYAIGRSG